MVKYNEEQENMETGVIYLITNSVNDKKYVGQALSYIFKKGKIIRHGLKGRFENHVNDALKGNDKCPKLYKAMRDIGIAKFKIELIEVCPIAMMDIRENHYIEKHNSVTKGYNTINGYIPVSKDVHERQLRIEKISNTMKKKWKDPDYKEKTTAANLKAVEKRANAGKTRVNNKELDLPANIYKTDKGYDIRIMRDGKYKITSVEGKDLTDDQKLQKAIEKRDEILENMKNGIDDSHKKALDHNGDPLPQCMTCVKVRGNDGYRVTIRKKINGKERRIESTHSDGKLTMDEKLEKAKTKLADMLLNKDKLFENLK